MLTEIAKRRQVVSVRTARQALAVQQALPGELGSYGRASAIQHVIKFRVVCVPILRPHNRWV